MLKIINKNYLGYWVASFFLFPTIFFGFTADDRQFVISRSLLIANGGIWDQIYSAVSNSSRFFPLHQALYVINFNYFSYNNVMAYHLFLLFLNLVAIYVFMLWVRQLFKVDGSLWLVLSLLVATQFRITYSDPIISYFGMMQIFSIAFFGALFFLEKYMVTSREKYFFMWVIFFLVQLLMYELAIFLVPLTIIAIGTNYKKKFPQVLRCLVTLTLALAIYFAIVLYLRHHSTESYSGTRISLDFWPILRTTLFEAMGSMPLSYGAYLASVKLGMSALNIWGSYLVWLIFFIALITLKVNCLTKVFLSRKFLYGICIWFLSSVSIAFSGRYQQEILPGLTYLVVYLQNFGFALCLFSIINWHSRISKTIIIGTVLATFGMNLLIINEGLKIDGAKRIVVEALLSKDLLDNYRFDQSIFNEKILQEEEFFEKNINKNLGTPIYVKLSEIKNLNIRADLNTGIILASTQSYSSAFMLVGKYNGSFGHIESVTLLTSSRERAEELSSIYLGDSIKTFTSNDKTLFGYKLRNVISISDQLNGTFR